MKKSNIERVKVTVSESGKDIVEVTYYSGITRNYTIDTMSNPVKEFITGNCNTIVREYSNRTVTTFYASETSLNNSIAVMKEQIVKRCMNSVETTRFIFSGEKFTLSANDFKIQCGKLRYTVGYNKAITINNLSEWDFNKAREVRDRIITNFKGR